MIELLLFILIGVIMYLVQLTAGTHLGWKKALIYLTSGMVGGLAAALLAKYYLPSQTDLMGGTTWPGTVIMGLIAGMVLYIASALDLYQRTIFQIFSTLILGIATGVITVAMYAIYATIAKIPWITAGQIGNRPFTIAIVMFCVLGFLIIFGYAMTARTVMRFRKTAK